MIQPPKNFCADPHHVHWIPHDILRRVTLFWLPVSNMHIGNLPTQDKTPKSGEINFEEKLTQRRKTEYAIL